jgi:hypothetical protein
MEELKVENSPQKSQVDRWHQAMVSENIWHQWFLAGTVESETMLSKEARLLIYLIMSKQRPVHRSDHQREVCFSCTVAIISKLDIELFHVN